MKIQHILFVFFASQGVFTLISLGGFLAVLYKRIPVPILIAYAAVACAGAIAGTAIGWTLYNMPPKA